LKKKIKLLKRKMKMKEKKKTGFYLISKLFNKILMAFKIIDKNYIFFINLDLIIFFFYRHSNSNLGNSLNKLEKSLE
jgi:hypothetical protein